jgi:glutamate dehydrogenase/leucine dehydrogenase
VIDNVAAGPSIGGLRMAEDVTVEECFRLARAMTLKNAAALKSAPAVRPISAPFRPA